LTERTGLETIAVVGMDGVEFRCWMEGVMTPKKNFGKVKKFGLKLSLEQRKLILGDPIRNHRQSADPIRATPTGAPVLLTLDDLEDLGAPGIWGWKSSSVWSKIGNVPIAKG
jgi:hypothetical protein